MCADHSAHIKLGSCDAANCVEGYRRICTYCDGKPEEVRNPKVHYDFKLKENVKPGAQLADIPPCRRVPDLLHMIKNVTKWFLAKTSEFIIPSASHSRTGKDYRSSRSQRDPESILKSRREKWIERQLDPYIHKTRKDSHVSSSPRSAESACWEYIKAADGKGYLSLINIIERCGRTTNKATIKINNPAFRRKIDEELTPKWSLIINAWALFHRIFFIISKNFKYHDDIEFLENNFKNLKQIIIYLKWKCTPWAHVFLEHYIQFEKMEIRPYYLSCHAIESHHKQIKKDFSQSLHSVRRRHGRSSLIDMIRRDNIILNLMGQKIFPWKSLEIPLGKSYPYLKRGVFKNFLKIKYPPIYPGETLNINNIIDSDEESLMEDDDSPFDSSGPDFF